MNKFQRVILLSASVTLALILSEGVFVLIAGGATWRLFTKDLPAQPNSRITTYFLGVLAGLAAVLWLAPGNGFGPR
jgi:hypothetical protein